MTRASKDFRYDVFISYSHRDASWVQDWLLPQLEAAKARVCIDFRDFEPGAPSITEMERAVLQSRKTLLVLTPNYLDSAWTEFENILAQTLDPAARQRRLLPLLLEPCALPLRISSLTYLDFTRPDRTDFQLKRLLSSLAAEMPATTDAASRPATDTVVSPSSPTQMADWNLSAIRELLTVAFDDEEIRTLCFDHFPAVYEDFSSGMSKRDKTQRLIEYCERHQAQEQLLAEVRRRNPSQYSRFESRLRI